MSNNSSMRIAPIPLVGQPFTLLSLMIPVTATLRCHCGGESVIVKISNGLDAPCASCHRMYRAFLDPRSGQIGIQMIGTDLA